MATAAINTGVEAFDTRIAANFAHAKTGFTKDEGAKFTALFGNLNSAIQALQTAKGNGTDSNTVSNLATQASQIFSEIKTVTNNKLPAQSLCARVCCCKESPKFVEARDAANEQLGRLSTTVNNYVKPKGE